MAGDAITRMAVNARNHQMIFGCLIDLSFLSVQLPLDPSHSTSVNMPIQETKVEEMCTQSVHPPDHQWIAKSPSSTLNIGRPRSDGSKYSQVGGLPLGQNS